MNVQDRLDAITDNLMQDPMIRELLTDMSAARAPDGTRIQFPPRGHTYRYFEDQRGNQH